MKAYTDIKQSRKLAEILPIESADMCFNISQRTNMPPLMTPYCKFKEFFNMEETPDFLIPCWSLAALLDILPETIEDEFAEYDLEIDMTYKKPKYVRLGDCYHSDFPSWDWDNKELLDNIVEAVIWLNNNGYLRNEKLH